MCFHQRNVQYHLYADDKQAYVHVPVSELQSARNALQDCIADVGQWCASRRLQLNASKTELIWFGSRQHLAGIPSDDLTLSTESGIIHPVNVVRDLGVLLDSELSMKLHISKVASCCFYQLRRLHQINRLVGREVTTQLVVSLILSRLDYCNSLLAGLPSRLLSRCSVFRTLLPDLSSIYVHVITLLQPSSNFIGCQSNSVSRTNYAC
jgi:hypothetical protein